MREEVATKVDKRRVLELKVREQRRE